MISGNFRVRLLGAFLAGVAGLGAFLAVAHYIKIEGSGLVPLGSVLLVGAALAGYFESAAKRVWLHVVLLMLPALFALAIGVWTCKGHGCSAAVVFAGVVSLFTFVVLLSVSFAAFLIQRRLLR